jgi:hypothetical protein
MPSGCCCPLSSGNAMDHAGEPVHSGEVVLRQRSCRRCHAVFWICLHCDRRKRYCSAFCRVPARQQQRGAPIAVAPSDRSSSLGWNCRHQQSLEGRLDHRDRQPMLRAKRLARLPASLILGNQPRSFHPALATPRRNPYSRYVHTRSSSHTEAAAKICLLRRVRRISTCRTSTEAGWRYLVKADNGDPCPALIVYAKRLLPVVKARRADSALTAKRRYVLSVSCLLANQLAPGCPSPQSRCAHE